MGRSPSHTKEPLIQNIFRFRFSGHGKKNGQESPGWISLSKFDIKRLTSKISRHLNFLATNDWTMNSETSRALDYYSFYYFNFWTASKNGYEVWTSNKSKNAGKGQEKCVKKGLSAKIPWDLNLFGKNYKSMKSYTPRVLNYERYFDNYFHFQPYTKWLQSWDN